MRGIWRTLGALAIATVLMLSAVVLLMDDGEGGLTLAVSNKVDYEPVLLAFEEGLFEEEGVRVSEVTITGGIQAAEAMMTGSADLGAMGESPALILMANSDARLVSRYAYAEGMHRFIADASIDEVSDLAGMRVGVQFGSSTHGALLAWLDANDLGGGEVELVPMPPSNMPDAMDSGEVDAMAGSEPWPTNVENRCGGAVREIGNSSGLGNRFPLSLMASSDVSDDDLEAVLRALERAVGMIEEDRMGVATLLSARTGLSPGDQYRCMAPLTYAVGVEQEDIDSMEMTAEFLIGAGRIDSVPDVRGHLWRPMEA